MLLLRCDKAAPTTDDNGRPCTVLCTMVVRPVGNSEGGDVPVAYVAAGWEDLPERYMVAGPLCLTRHPGGGNPPLTFSDFSVYMTIDGVYFFLSVADPAFDPSAVVGRVFAAEGRGGEPRRGLHFRWPSGSGGRGSCLAEPDGRGR